MSKTPLELLKEIEWEVIEDGLDFPPMCPICKRFEEQGHYEICQLAQAIFLLEAQPQLGEYRGQVEKLLDDCKYGRITNAEGSNLMIPLLHEACDRIDRLTEENKELRACHESELGVCQQHCDVVKSQQAEIKRLKAENKRLKAIADLQSNTLKIAADTYEEQRKIIGIKKGECASSQEGT